MLLKHCFHVTYCLLGILVYQSTATSASSAEPEQSYDILYHQAIEAYLEENWEKCVVKMNEAIEDYHFYKDAVVGCRLKCQRESQGNALISPLLEDMKLWEKMIKQTLCILKCKKGILKNRAEIVARNVNEEFEAFKPYDYIQLCYFKSNDLMKAASAAYTFLTINKEHAVMKENLRFYINELKVDPNYVLNMEAKPYVDFYIRGSESYKKNEFEKTANYMELSLIEYLEAEEECRALCEGPFDQGWFPDFISSISNHYTFTLRCKQRCPSKLGNVNGDIHENLLASHYHYLQFAYYKLENLDKACEATATFLLFDPQDAIMRENKKFYMTLPAVRETMFKPRQEALNYFERQKGESALLEFIEKNFQFDEGEISEPSSTVKPVVAKKEVAEPVVLLGPDGIPDEDDLPNNVEQEVLKEVIEDSIINEPSAALPASTVVQEDSQENNEISA